jgi:hypothetical protein
VLSRATLLNRLNPGWLGWLALFALLASVRGEVLINEVLFNPPGPDTGNEYIELRGTPNLTLAPGTYFLSVEGDTNGNPGVIQNLFDLSGRTLGPNGFLILCQKFHVYSPHPFATVLTNSDNGAGWGSGSSSSIDHRGEGGQTDLEDASCTFFLVQTANAPAINDDIDLNNDGTPDGPEYASWLVLDSVGVLDNSGLGDIAYGTINFRRDSVQGRTATASGVIVPVPFTPQYVGRNGNTTGSLVGTWVASDSVGGALPTWTLGVNSGTSTNTVPSNRSGAPLNHHGSPNFGAADIPGVRVVESSGSTQVAESGGTDSYSLSLNVVPSAAVTIQITAGAQVQVSTDGISFGTTRTLSFSSAQARTVTVRAINDGIVDSSPHFSFITHTITSTGDPTKYPTTAIVPSVSVGIIDNDTALLSEVKVNPPGSSDAPDEFIEIRGTPSGLFGNVYLVALEGDSSGNPGRTTMVVDLSGRTLGSSGLLVVAAPGHPYNIPANTTVVLAPQLGFNGGALENNSVSLALVASPEPIEEGRDYDSGDNGVMEELPAGAAFLDAVGWTDRGNNDVTYGGVNLTQSTFTPDAAIRFPGNITALSATAWFCGDLDGLTGGTTAFNYSSVSPNFPYGTMLSPGVLNSTPPRVSPIAPLTHVIGDIGNAAVTVTVSDDQGDPSSLTVTVTSMNQAVVPNANLALTPGPGTQRTLSLNPIGVGYADILVQATDGSRVGWTVLHYAASDPGRPGGHWHTGISDASATFPVSADWMFVGDDENQVIRLYSRRQSGGPVLQVDMNPFLELIDLYDDGRPREIDIEGATSVGNRIYWLGSHSHGLNGAAKTNRARLFATDISGSGTNSTLTFVDRYDFLKVDLIAWDAGNAHGKGANYYGLAASAEEGVDAKSPDGSGFNIEGLCMAPGSTNTGYISFRAPLVPPDNRASALIIPVTNFASLATLGGGPGSARFGAPIELNLGCRGIRSIEGGTNGFLIVAGPPGVATGIAPSDFRLFTWNGYATNAPQERAADLSTLNVESIVELPKGPWSPTNQVQLISDNGISVYYNDGIQAKALTEPNFKKFRADWVTLGEIVPVRPAFTSLTLANGMLTLTWCSVAATTYRLQYTFNLNQPEWINVSGEVVANSGFTSKSVTIGSDAQRFYRVVPVSP